MPLEMVRRTTSLSYQVHPMATGSRFSRRYWLLLGSSSLSPTSPAAESATSSSYLATVSPGSATKYIHSRKDKARGQRYILCHTPCHLQRFQLFLCYCRKRNILLLHRREHYTRTPFIVMCVSLGHVSTGSLDVTFVGLF